MVARLAYSREVAIFRLPINKFLIRDLSPMEYLVQYCKVEERRERLYKLVNFSKVSSENGNKSFSRCGIIVGQEKEFHRVIRHIVWLDPIYSVQFLSYGESISQRQLNILYKTWFSSVCLSIDPLNERIVDVTGIRTISGKLWRSHDIIKCEWR